MLPAAERGAPSSSAVKDSSVRRSSATSSIVPTRMRFMLRMNESASISNSSTSPSRRHSRVEDVAGEAPVVGLGGREGGEVVLAAERLRAGGERVLVDAVRPPQRAPALEGRRLAASEHAVAVAPADGVVAGGEAGRCLLGAQDDDLAREHRVDRAQVGHRAGVGDHLAERVDAAVRAAGDGQLDRLAQDGGERLNDFGGHGSLAGLLRPARERAAVVLQSELGAQTSSR